MLNLLLKSFFNQAITLNFLLSFASSFFLVIILMPKFIKIMNFYKVDENLRDLKIDYSLKKNIPPMGGLIIVFSVLVSYLLWTNFKSTLSFALPLFYLSFAFIGGVDDYIKIRGRKSGLKALFKILGQLIICSLFLIFIYNGKYNIHIPFNFSIFGKGYLYLGAFLFFVFTFFVMSGTSNAVNLTDGLDGLASLSLLTNFVFVFIYVMKDLNSVSFINQDYIEIAIFSCSIIGANLAFLWYNSYPAQVFMGDIGSLSYGGILGILFILIKQELALVILGIVFFIETFSVILQRFYKFFIGKKLFKLTPIHHHYELIGIHENKIVLRSFIISLFSLIFSVFLLFL